MSIYVIWGHLICLCLIIIATDKVQGGAFNDTHGQQDENEVVQRFNPSGDNDSNTINTRFFDENVQRAAAGTSIRDCLCQCHRRTFRDRYGRQHGNCKTTDQTGAQWCYVRTPVRTYLGNHGITTCDDLKFSKRYRGVYYSYQACATPYLDSDVCSYLLQNYRQTHSDDNYRNNIKPRLVPDTNQGNFKDKDGNIKAGNKWVKFPSVITLGDSAPTFIGDNEITENDSPTQDDTLVFTGDSKGVDTASPAKDENKNNGDDAVHFG